MNALPILQMWMLMIFLQFTPFSGSENHQSFTFALKNTPDCHLLIETTIIHDASGTPCLIASSSFTGNLPAGQTMAAVIQRLGFHRVLINIEGQDGIDMVEPGTHAQLSLFPGKKARLAVIQDDQVVRAEFESEKGTTPREVEFSHDGVRAFITYDPVKGLQKVRLSMPGMTPDPEFEATSPDGQRTSSHGSAASSYPIVKEFRGIVGAAMKGMPGTPGSGPASPEQLVIDSQEKYAAFVSRICPTVITMTSPAPRSDDPLLKMPPIDFSRERLIVLIANDGMYGKIEVKEITEKNGVPTLHCCYVSPSVGEMTSQQPMGIGRYHAFLFDATPSKWEFAIEKEQ